MNPVVRDLYKRFIWAGRVYPGGLEVVRRRAKEAFFRNAHLKDEVEIKKAVAVGRYMVKELIAVAQLKKYRAIKKNYEWSVIRHSIQFAANEYTIVYRREDWLRWRASESWAGLPSSFLFVSFGSNYLVNWYLPVYFYFVWKGITNISNNNKNFKPPINIFIGLFIFVCNNNKHYYCTQMHKKYFSASPSNSSSTKTSNKRVSIILYYIYYYYY